MDLSSKIKIVSSRFSAKDIKDDMKLSIVNDVFKPIKYLGFNQKYELIKSVIDDNYKIDNDFIYYNSCLRYRDFICKFLSVYLQEKVEYGHYDSLCEKQILPYIISIIQVEYDICVEMLNMYSSDIMSKRIALENG